MSGIKLPRTEKSALQVDEVMAAGRLLSQTKINNSYICSIALWHDESAIKEEADGGARTIY
jgi:hypothetical protein